MSQGDKIRSSKGLESHKGTKSRKPSQQQEPNAEQKSKMVIQTAKKQLDSVIEQLDSKIRRRLQINQCRFLYAYQTHLAKVTRQLKVLKQNQQIYTQKFSTDNAIMHLGKLCSFFRQQAMRLHTQLQNALTQAQIFRRKSQILQKQLQNTDQSHKRLMATHKNIQSQQNKLIQLVSQKQKVITELSSHKTIPQSQNYQSQLFKNRSEQKNKGKEMKITIPNTSRNSYMKLEEWLNRTATKSPKYSHQTPLLDHEIAPLTTKYNSFNSGKNARVKTKSTADYNRSFRKIDISELQSSHKNINLNQINCQNFLDEVKTFDKLMQYVKKARENPQQPRNIQLQSQQINQFINCNQDILKFCRLIFKNIKINQDLTINRKSTRQKSEQKSSLTYLSTELMRKFKIPQYNEKEDKTQSHHLDATELQYINKIERVKTQVKQRYLDINQRQLQQKRQKSSKKIDEAFKRKNTKAKSIITAFYNISKTHRDKTHHK